VSDDNWNLNSTVFYSCNEGYTRQGPAIITCKPVDGKGEWSDNPPLCELPTPGMLTELTIYLFSLDTSIITP